MILGWIVNYNFEVNLLCFGVIKKKQEFHLKAHL